ncbi:MAG: hypothetical protein AB7F43_09985 [Bacteriovoracia bacterium]
MKLNLKLVLVLGSLILVGNAFAKENVSRTNTYRSVVAESTTSAPRVSVGPAIAFASAETGWGAVVNTLFPFADSNWSVGFQSGYLHWSETRGSMTTSTNIVPILGTGVYTFTRDWALQPYLGASVGVAYEMMNTYLNRDKTSGSSRAEMTGLVRPGMEINILSRYKYQVGVNVYFEPSFGLIGSTFVAMPNLGAVVQL